MLLSIVSTTVLAAGAFLQTTNLISIGGIKPDIVLALLVVVALFYKDWKVRAFFVLLAAFILKFSPGLAWIDIIFIATAALAMALVDYLPWRRFINSLVAVLAGTIIIGIPSFAPDVLAIESLMNIALVIIFYPLLKWLYAKKA